MEKPFNSRSVIRVSIGTLALGLVLLSASTYPAMAMQLNFNMNAPTSGSVSYAGTGGGLIGSNIDVDTVVGQSTPANANVTSTCVACVLNFTSGSLSNSGGPNPSNSGWWRFSGGGSITITGGVDFTGSTPDISTGSTLLSGSFGSAFVQDLGAPGFQVTFGNFTDTKDASLLSYYGLPGGTYNGALTLLFTATNNGTGSAFTSTSLIGGTISNVAAVPVPAAVWLFGSGLLGLYSAARRKLAL